MLNIGKYIIVYKYNIIKWNNLSTFCDKFHSSTQFQHVKIQFYLVIIVVKWTLYIVYAIIIQNIYTTVLHHIILFRIFKLLFWLTNDKFYKNIRRSYSYASIPIVIWSQYIRRGTFLKHCTKNNKIVDFNRVSTFYNKKPDVQWEESKFKHFLGNIYIGNKYKYLMYL